MDLQTEIYRNIQTETSRKRDRERKKYKGIKDITTHFLAYNTILLHEAFDKL